jgi:hypothetical protein
MTEDIDRIGEVGQIAHQFLPCVLQLIGCWLHDLSELANDAGDVDCGLILAVLIGWFGRTDAIVFE